MTDTSIRRLEAEWKASSADDDAERLVVACRRARRDPPWGALRRCERWRRVDGFVTKWFTRPLAESNGVSPVDLDASAKARGWREPPALREWFQLAGRRADLTATEGWRGALQASLGANQRDGMVLFRADDSEDGCTFWSVPVDQSADDPRVDWRRGTIQPEGQTEHEGSRRGSAQPLSEFLLALVLRTLLVEARPWSRAQGTRNPLGAIHGYVKPSQRGLAQYHRLPIAFPDRGKLLGFHGDADTLIFIGLGDEGYLKGAARTRPALDRLQANFPDLGPALWP